jgi:hypothetical protein
MENFDETKRTYNTEVREPWNPVIKTCLDAIDRHMSLHLRTGCPQNLQQAELLRAYVAGLKEWVRSEEIKSGCGGGGGGIKVRGKPPLYACEANRVK